MGGLLALSALERSALQRVSLQALPCQGGFVGLYHGEDRVCPAYTGDRKVLCCECVQVRYLQRPSP